MLNIKLGPKGAPPPKAQINKRRSKKENLFDKFTRVYFDNDEGSALHAVKMYEEDTKDQQERILTGFIVGRGVPERIIKEVFNIGDYKYQRIKNLQRKKPSGGMKPNCVSIDQINCYNENVNVNNM